MGRSKRRGKGDIWRKIETYAIRNTNIDTVPKIGTGKRGQQEQKRNKQLEISYRQSRGEEQREEMESTESEKTKNIWQIWKAT